jgi:hypothetical protein
LRGLHEPLRQEGEAAVRYYLEEAVGEGRSQQALLLIGDNPAGGQIDPDSFRQNLGGGLNPQGSSLLVEDDVASPHVDGGRVHDLPLLGDGYLGRSASYVDVHYRPMAS